MDKFGGSLMMIAGSLLVIITIVDALDGSFYFVSKSQGTYQVLLVSDPTKFYLKLLWQVFIGIGVLVLGRYIYNAKKSTRRL
ncbi:hypothetical protein [Sessilibacter corallicola]|uniref:hypothetical protein n=1 Tax=Sessilibacter corallicola TaxID=2904075 RepID=UPI001E4E04F3|nr:hypothetical protein [Sessilibacter corallicola]MCE2029458.1 hypothetical protein [Sessilibacter corallicola]